MNLKVEYSNEPVTEISKTKDREKQADLGIKRVKKDRETDKHEGFKRDINRESESE